MIKQSFLRNYNVSKIYNQAQDQKKRLKVFYIRQVNRLVRDKRHQYQDQANNRLRVKNREEKQELSRLVQTIETQKENHNKTLVKRFRKLKKNNTQQSYQENIEKPRPKVDLFISTLQLPHHSSINYLQSGGISSNRKNLKGKTFVPKFNSSSVSFRPPWEQIAMANCPSTSQRKNHKQKFVTSPSFYEHFQNVKLKECKQKQRNSNVFQAVRKRLKRQQQTLQLLKVQLIEDKKENKMERCQSKESLLSPFSMFSPKSIGSSLASLNERLQKNEQD